MQTLTKSPEALSTAVQDVSREPRSGKQSSSPPIQTLNGREVSSNSHSQTARPIQSSLQQDQNPSTGATVECSSYAAPNIPPNDAIKGLHSSKQDDVQSVPGVKSRLPYDSDSKVLEANALSEGGSACEQAPSQNMSGPKSASSDFAESKPAATDVGIKTPSFKGLAGPQEGPVSKTPAASEVPCASQQSDAQGVHMTLASAQELGSAALENAQTAFDKVKQSIAGSLPDRTSAEAVGQAGKEKLAQASRVVIKRLDEQGISSTTSKQKLSDVGQAVKDYSIMGQETTGEYLQQAVDAAHAIGRSEENQSTVAKVLGAVALLWLAFGFSLSALFALAIMTAIAVLLSQYSERSTRQGLKPATKEALAPRDAQPMRPEA